MRLIAVFFGPCAPAVLISHVSVFPHDFKRLDRLTKLTTSSFHTASLASSGRKCITPSKHTAGILQHLCRQISGRPPPHLVCFACLWDAAPLPRIPRRGKGRL